ncbi:MAG: SpoIIE family protein phosphatase [Planctomycetes bacterium]|jgi:predicted ATPase/Tfp pilus assembly protein PilF|nr:SpoIIE family protein phosphatase [Planctomycetota bacterium]MCL4729126.1 SpoIIE family protein phosphatase [Planctomycetota bacterium]
MTETPAAGSELERARQVQLSMLPAVPQIAGLEVACAYRACDMLGGDFYDFILVDKWRLGVVIADVSGHGMSAALLMAAAKKAFQFCGVGCLSPRQALLAVNDSIRPDVPRGMFLSALYGIVDIRNRRLAFASAGHNPPMLWRAGRVRAAWQHPNAPVLGMMASERLGESLREELVQLQEGDLLLLHTDGVSEAFNESGNMYGAERLVRHLNAPAIPSAQAIVDAIQQDVDRFRGRAAQADDQTLLALRALPLPEKILPLIAGSEGPPRSLPEFSTSLVGRTDVVARLAEKLRAAKSPVMCVSGPAGVGKTRVAVAAAEAAINTFPGGVLYVNLASARDIGDVCRATAAVLGLGDDTAQLGLRIALALAGIKERALLLLDNGESCGDAIVRCVTEWRAKAPQHMVLLTTRLPVNIAGQEIFPLAPLQVARLEGRAISSRESALRIPSIALFEQRAREADPSFKLRDEDAATVAEICTRLDGLPLALELAASRVTVLSPRQILERLDQRFDLLGGDNRFERGTLSEALAWSWDLLDKPEQKALMMLSQLPSGFQLEVAAPMLDGIGGKTPEDLLQGLMKYSLAWFDRPEALGGERRFRLYESVRAFAQQRLQESGSEPAARARFEKALLDYTLRWWRKEMTEGSTEGRRRLRLEVQALALLAETTRNPESRAWATIMVAPQLFAGGDENRAMNLLRASLDGLMPGSDEWHWVHIIDGQLRLDAAPDSVAEAMLQIKAEGLPRFVALMTRVNALQKLGRHDEALKTVELAAAIPGLAPIRSAQVRDRIAAIKSQTGHNDEARSHLEAAVRIAREQGDMLAEGRFIHNLGWVLMRMGKAAEALACHEQSLKIAQSEDDIGLMLMSMGSMALELNLVGRGEEAVQTMQKSLLLARKHGRTALEASNLTTLGRIYHEQGHTRDALKAAVASRDLAREIGARHTEAVAESNVAAMRLELGETDGAMEAMEKAYEILRGLNDQRAATSTLGNIGVLHVRNWEQSRNQRDFQKGFDILQRATNERRSMGYDPMLDCELELAKLMIHINRKEDARRLLARTREYSVTRGDEAGRRITREAETLLASLAPPAAPATTPVPVTPAVGPRPLGAKRPRMQLQKPASSPSLPTGKAPRPGSAPSVPAGRGPLKKPGSTPTLPGARPKSAPALPGSRPRSSPSLPGGNRRRRRRPPLP